MQQCKYRAVHKRARKKEQEHNAQKKMGRVDDGVCYLHCDVKV